MDRTICGTCGCWLGDDLHHEITRLRTEVDKFETLYADAMAELRIRSAEVEALRQVESILDGLAGKAPTPLQWALICEKAAQLKAASAAKE